MSEKKPVCCPDYGADQSAILAELAEAAAAQEATKAEIRVRLEQRMEAGEDISPTLEILEQEGIPIGDLLFG